MPNVVFRVDGNSHIGYGHFIRCLALANKILPAFDIEFACSDPDGFLISQIPKSFRIRPLPSYPVYSPDDTRSEDEIPFDLENVLSGVETVVLDGYRFGPRYRQKIKDIGCKLVCIDDLSTGYYPADVIINPAPEAVSSDYEAFPDCQFLLGLDYALVRDEFFIEPSFTKKRIGTLLSIGGTDYFELTSPIAELLLNGNEQLISIVITKGFSTANRERIEKLKSKFPDKIEIWENVDVNLMIALMDRHEKAVLPSSGIMLEALARKMKIWFGYYAENQLPYYNFFSKKMAGGALGDLKELKTLPGEYPNLEFQFKTRSAADWQTIFKRIN